MDFRERVEAFWSGERPDRIPYAIYEWLYSAERDDAAWAQMFADGLGLIRHVSCYTEQARNVEVEETTYQEEGKTVLRRTYTTPVGSVYETWANGWQGECMLKGLDDYRVMTYIAENTVVESDLEAMAAEVKGFGPCEVALTALSRTPYQRMLVDLAGVGQFPFHLVDFEDEVRTLYEALRKPYRRRAEIAAEGSNRLVHFGENFNADAIGPKRYEEFIVPVYEECIGILHAAGKVVGAHYDGRTASCAEPIARSPLDLVESFTEPPEGDQTLAQARANWPDKLIWCNIGVSDYQLPPATLREKVLSMTAAGAPDGRRLALEVSEHLPLNWRESMPAVLDALKETQGA
ncbi:MAG: hypothetical protein ACYS8X_01595 [Planctomycetota bacterium]|jgi:hypothetical protein